MTQEKLLKNMQFRSIITFLRNGGMKLSAAFLVRSISKIAKKDMSIREALDYVDDCHVICCPDGTLKELAERSEKR